MKLLIEKDELDTKDYALERLINTYLPVLLAFLLGRTLVLWLIIPLLLSLLFIIDVDTKKVSFRY